MRRRRRRRRVAHCEEEEEGRSIPSDLRRGSITLCLFVLLNAFSTAPLRLSKALQSSNAFQTLITIEDGLSVAEDQSIKAKASKEH